MKIAWWDRGREPQCAPDLAYPGGKDLDGSFGASATCRVDLPYPAKRCGVYVVECEICGVRICMTTAGRPDDPRSITLGCRLPGIKH